MKIFTYAQLYFTYAQLYLKSFLSWKMLESVLSAFGLPWILVSILVFFSGPDFSDWLKTLWWLFLASGCLIGIYKAGPLLSYRDTLKGRDIQIEIKVDKLFRQKGAWVIGINTTFDTDTTFDAETSSSIISKESLQGQFTTRFYSSWKELDKEVKEKLKDRSPEEELNGTRKGKSTRYRMGETICVQPSNGSSTYLVAISHMNEHGTASGTLDDLRQALAGLWCFIRAQPGEQSELAIPILGTGRTGLKQTREEVVTEIIRSFIAASAEATFCPKFTVVIHPSDVSKYGINLHNLKKFLWVICNFNSVVSSETNSKPLGEGIST